MAYNPDIHHRRSIRLRGYDYTQAGACFITICAQGRECLFGEVTDGEVILSASGHIVAACWLWLAEQYLYVDLDEWAVMPNHLHGVIVIADEIHDDGKGGSRTAPTTRRKPLGRLIGAFKTVSTKHVNDLRGTAGMIVWQRNYYEHIIRNEEDLNRIRAYIAGNPAGWAEDEENPERIQGES